MVDALPQPKLTDDFAVLGDWEIRGRWVAALMCRVCGATVLTHPSIDTTQIHLDWHEALNRETARG